MNLLLKFSVTTFMIPLFLLGSFHASEAQQARAGIKGGINVSNLYVNNVDDENSRIGFHIGLYGQMPITQLFAIQPELNYSTKGTKTVYNGAINQSVKFNLDYLDLPLLAVFKLGKVAEIQLGAYGGYLVNANVKTEGDIGDGTRELNRDNFNKFDYGLVGGLGLNFGQLQVGARYNYGLQKVANSDGADLILGDAKNSLAQLYAAINLNNQ